MQIIASDLIRKLEPLNILINSKSLVENCNKLHFDGKTIHSFNGEVFTEIPFESEWTGIIEGKLFFSMIQKFNESTIQIEKKDDNLIIKKNKSFVFFNLQEKNKTKLYEKNEEIDWKKLPDKLIEKVNNCAFVCGNDYTDMRTVCLHIKNDIVEATDSYRIIRCQNKDIYIEDELLIPVDLLKLLNKNKPTYYAIDENWCYFKNDKNELIGSRIISLEKDYPNIDSILKTFSNFEKIELPSTLYNSIDKVNLLLSDQFEGERFVNLNFQKKFMTVKANNSSTSFREKIKTKINKQFSFNINPNFLMQIIEKNNIVQINEKSLKIEFEDYLFLTSLMLDKEGESNE